MDKWTSKDAAISHALYLISIDDKEIRALFELSVKFNKKLFMALIQINVSHTL